MKTGLLSLAVLFVLTACGAEATISSPGKSDDAIRADMNSCDAGMLTLHDRPVIDCLSNHGDTITYSDGSIPPFTASNPYGTPMTAAQVQARTAAATAVLERWKAAARERDQNAATTTQPSQQVPAATTATDSYQAPNNPPTAVASTPVATDSQIPSTPSAASGDTPNQDRPGWLERVAAATKSLANRFHDYERSQDVVNAGDIPDIRAGCGEIGASIVCILANHDTRTAVIREAVLNRRNDIEDCATKKKELLGWADAMSAISNGGTGSLKLSDNPLRLGDTIKVSFPEEKCGDAVVLDVYTNIGNIEFKW